jgi:hypothetical protein
VMFDVVIEVRVPSVPHHRIENVREQRIKPCILFGKDSAAMNVLVHHECVGPDIVRLH